MNESIKTGISKSVEAQMPKLKEIKKFLFENPELGGEEEKSSALLIKYLREHGFDVTENFYSIDWCFRACFDSGKPGPAIGLTAEYDALPGIGHGCGHNIIATAPTGAAVALKEAVMEKGGKVILYGTPAEECFLRKGDLAREGAFEEIDLCLNIHPYPINLASGKTTAADAWQIEFYGKSSHAGAAPEEGINALDAAVHFYSLIGFEKQYLKNTNIYGVFVDGGVKCNVIPDHASVKYLVRAETIKDIAKIREMFERCAKAACQAVGTTYEIWNNEPSNMDIVSNQTLSDVFNKFYEEVGGGEMPNILSGASTDVGDVSHCVPTIMPMVGLGCEGTPLHTREFAEATMTNKADEVLKMSAIAMALTGAEVLDNPELLKEIKAEFEEAKKNF